MNTVEGKMVMIHGLSLLQDGFCFFFLIFIFHFVLIFISVPSKVDLKYLSHFNSIINNCNLHLAILFQAAISRTFDKKTLSSGKLLIEEDRWRYVRYNKNIAECLENETVQKTAGRPPLDAEVEKSFFDYMESVSTPGQLRNRSGFFRLFVIIVFFFSLIKQRKMFPILF
jgi:hypothetical protein